MGIFALPFAVYQVGFWKGLLILIGVALVNWLLNLAYSEVVLASRRNCQLAGYGRAFWGKKGHFFSSLAILININGALLAYLTGAGSFLNTLFPFLNSSSWGLIFFLVIIIVMAFGLKLITKINYLSSWLLILIIGGFLFWGIGNLDISSLGMSSGGSIITLVSIALFSCAGFAVVPEVGEIAEFKRKEMFWSVTIGSLLPVILYGLFTFVGLGLLGDRISTDFISSLNWKSPSWAWVITLAAILALLSSFSTLGFALREFWHQDLKLDRKLSFCLAFFPVVVIYMLANWDFSQIISSAGGFSSLLMAIMIVSCWLKTKRLP